MNEFAQQRPRRRIPPRDRSLSMSRDHGFSVVEVVFTITLIGLVLVPLLQATLSSIRASSTAGAIVEVDSVLQDAADRVTRAGTLCEYDTYVQAALTARGWSTSQVTATYQHYEPGVTAKADTPGTWVDGACVGDPPQRTARLIQKVSITVTSKSGAVSRSIQVVKSDV